MKAALYEYTIVMKSGFVFKTTGVDIQIVEDEVPNSVPEISITHEDEHAERLLWLAEKPALISSKHLRSEA